MLGACFLLYPGSRIRTWIFPIFLLRIPAWIFLGVWFLYQLIEASLGLFSASANGGGVAFFAHVGGSVFGLVVTWLLARAGQVAPRELERSIARPAGSFPRRAGRRRTPKRRCVSASYQVRSKLSYAISIDYRSHLDER